MREDSRALLKLLLESGQGYDDIAALLGTDAGAVRERARDALGELGAERPSPELTDYLLGQASPVDRAAMARRLSDDPGDAKHAAVLAERLRQLAPRASLPSLPAAPGASTTGAGAGDVSEPRETHGSRARLLLALAAIAILVAGVVLAVTGGFGGEDDSADSATGPSLEDADAVSVDLAPSADEDASGEAVLGLATTDQPFVDLTMKGLEEPEASDVYILWLMVSEERGWPLGIVEPDAQGNQSERYPVPSFLLQTNIIKGLRSITVSRSPRQGAFDAADDAVKSGVPEVDFVGDPVATGSVPNSGAIAPRATTP